jgi:hypothetical protein
MAGGAHVQNNTIVYCHDTMQTSFVPDNPTYRDMGIPPSCDPSETDTACVACAKASCCGEFQACSSDTNCSCLVGCLAMGGSQASCIAMCGSYSDVSTTTTTCLDRECPDPVCPTAGDMSGGVCPQSPGGGAGGSSTSSCTPGSAGPGESCFSDGDCSSCACNTGTMTCN